MEAMSSELGQENQKSANSSKLGTCEVCAINVAKYTCPKCEVKTCSLNCLKIHKQELECDGVRDKTKYIPLKTFTDLDLASDYRFLEECGRVVENHRKETGKMRHRFLPKYLHNLRLAALNRKINLQILPDIFERRKRNTSRLDFKSKTIHWRFECVFPSADNIVLAEERISEKEILNKAVSKYFEVQEDAVIQEKLQFYHSEGLRKMRLLLKAEKKGKNKFYELDGEQTILENLRNKTIIEYPVIHVIFARDIDLYEIVDSDQEDEVTNKEEHRKNKSKNLLFGSDHSDLSDTEP